MQVVLVAENPNARVAKIAYGLKSAGCEVILLHKNALNAESRGDYFAEIHAYRDENEALQLASVYRPIAFHVFSLHVDMTSLAFVKERPGKVVMDVYDTSEGIAYDWAVQGRPYQRFCLENADGVCARDLRLRWLRRVHGYRYRRAILFLDCCWNRSDFEAIQLPKIATDAIHLVAAGYILLEKQGHTEQSYLQVARDLAEQGVHFHVYPSPMQAAAMEAVFSEYLDLARELPYLHIHQPIALDRMTAELSQYHGGVAFGGGYIYGERPRDYDIAYYRYCSAARIFDYVDAGLPVLDNRGCFEFRFWLMARYGAAIDVTIDVLGTARNALFPLLSPEIRKGVTQACRAYAVHRHIGRLMHFYQSL